MLPCLFTRQHSGTRTSLADSSSTHAPSAPVNGQYGGVSKTKALPVWTAFLGVVRGLVTLQCVFVSHLVVTLSQQLFERPRRALGTQVGCLGRRLGGF